MIKEIQLSTHLRFRRELDPTGTTIRRLRVTLPPEALREVQLYALAPTSRTIFVLDGCRFKGHASVPSLHLNADGTLQPFEMTIEVLEHLEPVS